MQKPILTLMICIGAVNHALGKECKLFVNDKLREACFAAAEEASRAAEIAATAAEKAKEAADAEDDRTSKAGESGSRVTPQASGAAEEPCSDDPWAWQKSCKPAGGGGIKALSLPGFSVNDKIDGPGGAAGKGASFGASTANGQTSIKSAIAVTYKLPEGALFKGAARELGWNGGIAAQWNKDNSSKSKVDGRTVRLFVEGKVPDFPFLASGRLDGVDDNVAKERTVGLRFNVLSVPQWSQWGAPYDSGTWRPAYDLYVSGGTHMDRITYAKPPTSSGNAVGLNGRVDADFFPNGLLWHFHVFGTYIRAHDLYADNDRPKRSATYYDFGLEWVFARPDQKGKGLIPALSLHRTIGSNFLDGTAHSVSTSLMLTLKSN